MLLAIKIVGLIIILLGFFMRHSFRKERKENQNLKYALIKDVEETDDGYNVSLEYLNEDGSPAECKIKTNSYPKSDHIIIEVIGPLVSVYDTKTGQLIIPMILWVIGALLCII